MNLLRRKSITDLQTEALTDHSLKRALGALNLTMLGIGAIIGTGIFVLTGTVAALNAGPAVVLSFVLAGDRKSTRLNSSHGYISYAVFCLKKKKKKHNTREE